MKNTQSVLCIVGPTASGKTALSVQLALTFCGEIISADSMQIYRGMDIGTAKPTLAERQGIPHYMIDVVNPNEEYSAALYAQDAARAVDEAISKGKIPIVVGGTGFYIDALIRGGDFAERASDDTVREKLESIANQPYGMNLLLKRLEKIDKESFSRLHPNDKKRIIRAIEVFEVTGHTISEHNSKTANAPPRYNAVYIGLYAKDRQMLYDRINARVDKMFNDGLEQEVRGLADKNLLSKTSAQAIGYKELIDYFNGEITLDDAKETIKKRSRNYAKRQMTWFSANKDIFWIDITEFESLERLVQISTNFYKSSGVL